MPLELLFE
jgi:hypothetical protein